MKLGNNEYVNRKSIYGKGNQSKSKANQSN